MEAQKIRECVNLVLARSSAKGAANWLKVKAGTWPHKDVLFQQDRFKELLRVLDGCFKDVNR